MSFSDKLKLIIDVDAKGAIAGLSGLKTKMSDADGFFGKLKAGAGGLGDMFKSLGPAGQAGLAAGGIGAVGTAAFAAVSKFEDLGLKVGDFSDKTGLSTQESSRWVEVAGDMGIEAESLEGVLGKMNKSIDPAKWQELGVQIAYAKDGTVNVNETFLNAIDHLHGVGDATERAKEGAALFGKGWATVSEMVGEGAESLRGKLADVADVKILSPDDVKDARSFRDAMDNLKDVGEELVLTFGKALLPAMTSLANTLDSHKGAIETAGKGLGLIGSAAGIAADGIDVLVDSYTVGFTKAAEAAGWAKTQITGDVLDLSNVVAGLPPHFDANTASISMMRDHASQLAATLKNEAEKNAADLALQLDNTRRAGEELTAQWDALKGSINDDQAFINVQNQFDQVKAAAQASWDAASSGAVDAAQKARDHASSVDDLKLKVIDFGQKVLGLPPERVTKILADIDNGSLAAVQQKLEILTRNRTMVVDIQTRGGAGVFKASPRGSVGVAGAEGAIVNSPTVSLIGEDGPEALIPLDKLPGNRSVPDMSRMGGGSSGGGGNTYITQVVHTRAIPTAREWQEMEARNRRNGYRRAS